MRKIWLWLLVFIFSGQAGWALLPPLYHTLSEFKALLEDKQLTEKLTSGEAIISIELTDKSFTVMTNQHKLVVDIVFDKSETIGPAKFHLVFHDPEPYRVWSPEAY
jgi:hypothetical protein